MEIAYQNSPLGDKDELGSHLGKADIGQVRYFEGPDYGICSDGSQKQIGIEMVDMSGTACMWDEFCGGGATAEEFISEEGGGICIGNHPFDMKLVISRIEFH